MERRMLGVFMAIREWSQGVVHLCGQGLIEFENPASTTRGNTHIFSSTFLDLRQEGKRGS